MAEQTRPAPAHGKGERRAPLARFDRVERVVHWLNATLFGILILTGATLYFEPLMRLVGRRELVERIHVYAGLALPAPVIIALAGSWGAALRADIRRFNRFSPDDRAWLRGVRSNRWRRVEQRRRLRVGKFNAGQKLNAAFTAGAGLVMLGTGVILRWYGPWPLSYRAGATFVHNWLALVIIVAITGHVLFALSDREALRSIFKGTISRSWADRHAPAWLDEIEVAENKGRRDEAGLPASGVHEEAGPSATTVPPSATTVPPSAATTVPPSGGGDPPFSAAGEAAR